LFDGRFYREVYAPGSTDAAEHYVAVGCRAERPFNPLIEPEYLPEDIRHALRQGRIADVISYLHSPQAEEHPWGPRLHPQAVASMASRASAHASANRDAEPDGAHRDLIRAISDIEISIQREGPSVPEVDWRRLVNNAAQQRSGCVSIVMIAFEDHARTTASIDRIISTTRDLDVEIHLIDNGSRAAVGRVLAAKYVDNSIVNYVRLPINTNFAGGCNIGASLCAGEYVLFLNNDTLPTDGWLPPLVRRIGTSDVRGVQPLMIYRDGTVQTAGTVFAGRRGLASHFLAGHPMSDALRHSGAGFRAVTAGALLTRFVEFAEMNGFDESFRNGQEDVDYCLRATARFGGSFAVESRSVIIHDESKSPGRFAHAQANREILVNRWDSAWPAAEPHHFEEVGLRVAHTMPDVAGPTGIARPIVVRDTRAPSPGVFSLRWALRTGRSVEELLSHGASLADSIAVELEALEQQVVIDSAGVFVRETCYLDDVVVTLPGEKFVSSAGRINILWFDQPRSSSTPAPRGADIVVGSDAGSTSTAIAVPHGASLAETVAAVHESVTKLILKP
jgi:GT2 family glycosyltransferase